MFGEDLPEDHDAFLRTLTNTPTKGTPEERALPSEIVEKYWALQRCFGRVGLKIVSRDLAVLAYECGFGIPLGAELKDDLSDLKHNAPCEVLWKKTWRKAKFIRNSVGGKVVCQINGDSEERFFNGAHVRLVKVAAAA